jgi:hypothetical protein
MKETHEASHLSTSAMWKTRTLVSCLRGASDGWILWGPYNSIRRRRSEIAFSSRENKLTGDVEPTLQLGSIGEV